MGLEPIWISPFDFKSNAYTNSAIRAYWKRRFAPWDATVITKPARVLEAPTGIEPVYKVLQTSA